MGSRHRQSKQHMMGFDYSWTISLLIMILLLLIISFLIYKLIRKNQNTDTSTNVKKALEILEQRYAQGEMTDEEFKHKKKVLEE